MIGSLRYIGIVGASLTWIVGAAACDGDSGTTLDASSAQAAASSADSTSTASSSSGAGGGGQGSGGGGGSQGSGGSGGMAPGDPRCGAVLFDGVHAIVVAPPIAAYNPTGSFTVEAWIYPTKLPSPFGIVAGHHKGVSDKSSYNLAIDPSGHAVFAFSPDGTQIVVATTAAAIPLSAWSHVAGMFDINAQKIYAFIDGDGAATAAVIAAKPFAIDSVPFDVGREAPSTNPENPFNGFIDEVRVSSVARYASVFEPLQKFVEDANTVALYHFDEKTGQTAADSSANLNTANLQQNAVFAAPPGCK